MDENKNALEKEERVVLGDQEVKNIRDFFTRFKLTLPNDFDAVLTAFCEPDGKTVRNQKLIKMWLADIMFNAENSALSPIPIFRDAAFDTLKQVCSKSFYDLKFDFEVEKTLTEKNGQTVPSNE